MAIAEAAVADDPLGGFLALLEVAARLTGRHDARGCGSVGTESISAEGEEAAERKRMGATLDLDEAEDSSDRSRTVVVGFCNQSNSAGGGKSGGRVEPEVPK
ncbi:uncharacterized protein ATNIH1004_000665 [Aspergillus tanneri]|uniref:Uncharacterized protein n=1 Tax=Aspergillus tanneri TaxID=1220188 RepID=A0A5M9N443_9EURO|nr:uncharacterized protein ATNIH1004_000665 [Aspergillus tanneri]KAA8651769.1 hypothetical protein ATNIH1004_000665 [Aspergillus tanneri]